MEPSPALFSGRIGWFSTSCPRAHIVAWTANGGIKLSSTHTWNLYPRAFDYIFLKDLDDPVYPRLISSTPVLISSSWIRLSVEQNRRLPFGSFLLDENYAPTALSSDPHLDNQTRSSPGPSSRRSHSHPFKTPLRTTQSHPPSISSSSVAPLAPPPPSMNPAPLPPKRKRQEHVEPPAPEKRRKQSSSPVMDDFPPPPPSLASTSASASGSPSYLLPSSTPNGPPTTTPLLLLTHIRSVLPLASSIPDRGAYTFGPGGSESHKGGVGIGVFDVEGGRAGGRFVAEVKRRVKIEEEKDD